MIYTVLWRHIAQKFCQSILAITPLSLRVHWTKFARFEESYIWVWPTKAWLLMLLKKRRLISARPDHRSHLPEAIDELA
jgi:hypothetical protein